MSKDAWFRNYERLYNEREAGEISGSDDDLAERARDEQLSQIDRLRDEDELIGDEDDGPSLDSEED